MKKYKLVIGQEVMLIETYCELIDLPNLPEGAIVIAGLENLPSIDYSKLSEEDSFKVVDSHKSLTFHDLEQSLIEFASSAGSTDGEVDILSPASSYKWINSHISKLLKSRTTIFDVKIKTLLQVKWGIEWHDLENQEEGRDPDGIYRKIPWVRDGKITILKIN